MNSCRLILTLACLVSVTVTAQVPVVNSLSNLLALPVASGNRTQRAVDVLGVTGPYDGIPTMRWVWDGTNTTSTNEAFSGHLVKASSYLAEGAPGRWLHKWGGDPRVFGMVFGSASTSNNASANDAAFRAVLNFSRSTGIPINLAPGATHVLGNYDASSITKISGFGTLGPPIQTEFVLCQKGANLFTNITAGTTFDSFGVRPLHFSWVRDDNTSTAFVTQSGQQYELTFHNITVYGLWRGASLQMFDSKIESCLFTGTVGLHLPTAGTQNHIDRVAIRGMLPACQTNSSTGITIASYTAGTTNITVSDGSILRVGDYIACPVVTAPGISNGLQAKSWGRRVDAVSGNDITISNPWPIDFTNGQVYYLLGAGQSALYDETENHYTSLNIEWGVWDTLLNMQTPGTRNIGSLHLEGIVTDRPGNNRNWIAGTFGTLKIGYLNVVNGTILDTTGASIFDGTGSYIVDAMFMRDIDMFHATPKLYLAKETSVIYSGTPLYIRYIANYGVNLDTGPFAIDRIEQKGADWQGGQDGQWLRMDGLGSATHYGYSTIPSSGSFVAGDRVQLSTNTIVCATSGTYGSPAGVYRIKSGSRVIIPDLTGRLYLSKRKAITIGGSQYIIERPAPYALYSNVLSAGVSAGARSMTLPTTSGMGVGDWACLDFAGTSEDVRVQRIDTANNRIFLTAPLTSAHSAGATFETGPYLRSASATTVDPQASIQITAPTWHIPIVPSTAGAWSTPGLVTLGSASLGTVLDLLGGAAGVRHIRLTRSGVATNGIGVGAGAFNFWEESPTRQVFQAVGDSVNVSLNLGSTFGITNGRASTITAESAITGTTNENLTGGPFNVYAGSGSGVGALANMRFWLPITNSVSSNAQARIVALKLEFPATPDATLSNTPIRYPVWNGSSYVEYRVVATNESGALRPILVFP